MPDCTRYSFNILTLPPPCTSTAAVPKHQAKQRPNAHPVLSFKDALAVTQKTITVQSMSYKGGKAASHHSTVLVQTRRRSCLPHVVLRLAKPGAHSVLQARSELNGQVAVIPCPCAAPSFWFFHLHLY